MESAISFAAGALVLLACPATAQSQQWVRQIGSTGSDTAHAVSPDAAGGAFFGGLTNGSLSAPSAGAWDCWLARVNSSGAQMWVQQFGTTPDDELWALVADGAGGVLAAGTTQGLLGALHAGGGDAWIARYDADGVRLWIRQLGTEALDEAKALVLDGSGGFFVAGATTGSLGAPNGGDRDVWLARYDLSGDQQWLVQTGGADTEEAYALTLDGVGGVFLAGLWVGEGSGPFPFDRDALLARYTGAGALLWSQRIGVAGLNQQDVANALAPDGEGGAFVAGSTLGSLGGTHAGGMDAWIGRYDASGNCHWLRQLGSGGGDSIFGLTPDGAGGVHVAGNTDGGLGGGFPGSADPWTARYDAGGARLLLHNFGTDGFEAVRAVVRGPSGALFIAGFAWGDYGGPGSGVGQMDAFLARFGQPSVNAYCFGDGSGSACPCGNTGAGGRGCANGSTLGAQLVASGSTSLTSGDLVLSGSYLPATAVGVYVQGAHALNGGLGNPFGNGLLCIGGGVVRLQLAITGAHGTSSTTTSLPVAGGPLSPGETRRYQLWYRDPHGACGTGANLTNALEITWAP